MALAVWLASALYVLPFVDRGWIAHDEGVVGQSAERVLAGELPQRDYDDVYTGGLSILHALAFRVLGVRLYSLRLVLLVGFLAFVPALFAVSRRFAPPLTAGLLTLLGVAWSVPNYFASIPSWYNLFLAMFATLAFLLYVESGHRWWIFLAGLFAGLSVLMKLHGVFLVAAGLLFLVYQEETSLGDGERDRRSPVFALVKAGALFAFAALLWRVVSTRPGEMEYLHFFVPSAALCAFLVWSERRNGHGTSEFRWRRLLRLQAPFLAGVAVPIAVFLVPYAASGTLPVMVRGVFLLSANRLTVPKLGAWLPTMDTFRSGLLYGGLLLIPASFWRAGRRGVAAAGAVLLCAALFVFSKNSTVFREVFQSARSLGVLAVLAACLQLVRRTSAGALAPARRQALFLVSAMAAMITIVQFPYAAPIYFCFAAPMVAVAVLAIAADPMSPRGLHFAVLVFYLAFGVLRANVGYVFNFGRQYERYQADQILDPVRAGLRVPSGDRAMYESLVAIVREKSALGVVFAGPDCPEVSFLSDRPNPTRSLVSFLGAEQGSPQPAPGVALRLLREMKVRVVVINREPGFSRVVPNAVIAAIASAYPGSREIGRFAVFWQD